jgi:hypothetical protein
MIENNVFTLIIINPKYRDRLPWEIPFSMPVFVGLTHCKDKRKIMCV